MFLPPIELPGSTPARRAEVRSTEAQPDRFRESLASQSAEPLQPDTIPPPPDEPYPPPGFASGEGSRGRAADRPENLRAALAELGDGAGVETLGAELDEPAPGSTKASAAPIELSEVTAAAGALGAAPAALPGGDRLAPSAPNAPATPPSPGGLAAADPVGAATAGAVPAADPAAAVPATDPVADPAAAASPEAAPAPANPASAGAKEAARQDIGAAGEEPTAEQPARALEAPTGEDGEAPPRAHAAASAPRAGDAAPAPPAPSPAAPLAAPEAVAASPAPLEETEAPRAPAPPAQPPLPEDGADTPGARWTLLRTAAGERRARVHLDHPTLGSLHVDFALDDSGLDVRVLAPSLVAALRLERDQNRLRSILEEHGTRLAALRVVSEAAERPGPTPERPRPNHDGRLSLTA